MKLICLFFILIAAHVALCALNREDAIRKTPGSLTAIVNAQTEFYEVLAEKLISLKNKNTLDRFLIDLNAAFNDGSYYLGSRMGREGAFLHHINKFLTFISRIFEIYRGTSATTEEMYAFIFNELHAKVHNSVISMLAPFYQSTVSALNKITIAQAVASRNKVLTDVEKLKVLKYLGNAADEFEYIITNPNEQESDAIRYADKMNENESREMSQAFFNAVLPSLIQLSGATEFDSGTYSSSVIDIFQSILIADQRRFNVFSIMQVVATSIYQATLNMGIELFKPLPAS